MRIPKVFCFQEHIFHRESSEERTGVSGSIEKVGFPLGNRLGVVEPNRIWKSSGDREPAFLLWAVPKMVYLKDGRCEC